MPKGTPPLGRGRVVAPSGARFLGTSMPGASLCLHLLEWGCPCPWYPHFGGCLLTVLFLTGEPGPEGVYNEITQPVTHSGYLHRATAPPRLPGTRKSREGKCGVYGKAWGAWESVGSMGECGVPTPPPLTPPSHRLPARLVLTGEISALLRDGEMHRAPGPHRERGAPLPGREQSPGTHQPRHH